MNPDFSLPTRIVEPETVHVHQPITRMDGTPAFPAPAEVTAAAPEECVGCTVAGDEALSVASRKRRGAGVKESSNAEPETLNG